MKINIYGDICPTESNLNMFLSGYSEGIFKDIETVNRQSDFNIANLECAFGDGKDKTDKPGPSMIVPLKCIKAIADAGFHVMSVANNHALDSGIKGLEQEIEEIHRLGMLHVGTNMEGNTSPYIVLEKEDIKIAIYSVTDYEYNIDEHGFGVNIYNEIDTYMVISELSKTYDYTLVLYHSGMENCEYPSPDLMKRCRRAVDFGAKAILCQHSHCIGAYENYKNGLILYGQGNFLFDLTKRKTWHEGLIVRFDIDKNNFSYSFVPTYVQDGAVHTMCDLAAKELSEKFEKRSQEIADAHLLQEKWGEFFSRQAWKYNAMLLGGSKLSYLFCKMIDKISRNLLLSSGKKKNISLFLRSDTHREAIKCLLEIKK